MVTGLEQWARVTGVYDVLYREREALRTWHMVNTALVEAYPGV